MKGKEEVILILNLHILYPIGFQKKVVNNFKTRQAFISGLRKVVLFVPRPSLAPVIFRSI
jgi:hypothetical protein